MKFFLSAAVLWLAALLPAQRADALVRVHYDGKLLEGATVHMAVGNTVAPVVTDQWGVAYFGDPQSSISVFAYGYDPADGLSGWITFLVTHPEHGDRCVWRMLPVMEGYDPAHPAKLVETFDVDFSKPGPVNADVFLRPDSQKALEKAIINLHRGERTDIRALPFLPPWPIVIGGRTTTGTDCQYREIFVGAKSLLCHESSLNFNSYYVQRGRPSSVLDYTEDKQETHELSASWSAEVEATSQIRITNEIGGGFSATTVAGGAEAITTKSRVTLKMKFGEQQDPALCGYVCLNASQKAIFTQRQKRCCQVEGMFGCAQWGEWRDEGPEIETRVATGFCTHSVGLFDCNNPPQEIPGCAQ